MMGLSKRISSFQIMENHHFGTFHSSIPKKIGVLCLVLSKSPIPIASMYGIFTYHTWMVWDWFFLEESPNWSSSQGAQQTSDCDLISIGLQQFLPTGDSTNLLGETRIDPGEIPLKNRGASNFWKRSVFIPSIMNFRGQAGKKNGLRFISMHISYIHLPSGKLT